MVDISTNIFEINGFGNPTGGSPFANIAGMRHWYGFFVELAFLVHPKIWWRKPLLDAGNLSAMGGPLKSRKPVFSVIKLSIKKKKEHSVFRCVVVKYG